MTFVSSFKDKGCTPKIIAFNDQKCFYKVI